VSQIEVITGEASKRYAQALLDLAFDSKSLKKIENDVSILKSILIESNDLQKAISSPVIDVEKKIKVLTSIAKAAGLSKLSTQFIGTVTKNRRSHDLLNILSFFQVMVAQKKGTQLAKLTSSQPLTPAQLKEIKSNLKKTLGRQVDVETSVDPDLLGGFILRVGSRLYDSSLKTKLEDLKIALKEV
jgi:F-type H+-transporting ATPase subunit delta